MKISVESILQNEKKLQELKNSIDECTVHRYELIPRIKKIISDYPEYFKIGTRDICLEPEEFIFTEEQTCVAIYDREEETFLDTAKFPTKWIEMQDGEIRKEIMQRIQIQEEHKAQMAAEKELKNKKAKEEAEWLQYLQLKSKYG